MGPGALTTRLFPLDRPEGTMCCMDHQGPAQDMHELYRAVLDTVWRLERAGERDAAFRIRGQALKVYSTRWDEGGRRALVKINADAQRRLASSPGASSAALAASPEPS
jgi:hypothetical protein